VFVPTLRKKREGWGTRALVVMRGKADSSASLRNGNAKKKLPVERVRPHPSQKARRMGPRNASPVCTNGDSLQI